MLKHKILGLDVGSKTVGIAISDLMGWTAQGLDTLRINEEQDDLGIDQLVKIIKDNQVGTVVIGLPKNMNNSIGFRGEASIKYKEKLQESIPSIDIVMWDERLSTMAAERSLLEADVSRQKRKKVIDKMAAVFIFTRLFRFYSIKEKLKMTEHNHDAELTINNEEELLTLYDENGNEVLYRKMLEFYHPEFKKEYVVLAEEGAQSDDEDMLELVPMINEPDESGDGGKLVPIETDEEWDMIEEVVNTEINE